MKYHLVRTIRSNVGAAFMLAMVASSHAVADDGAKRHDRHAWLVGTWDVQVTTRDCLTSTVLRTFPSILTYHADGTLIESTAGIPQAAKTPGHGVWSHIRDNAYLIRFKSLRFDPSGNFAGTTVISQIVRVTSHGSTGESTGTVELYAPNGTLVLTGCSISTATRFD